MPEQTSHSTADDIPKFMLEIFFVAFSLKIIHKSAIGSTLFQEMTWCGTVGKPLLEAVVAKLTDIYMGHQSLNCWLTHLISQVGLLLSHAIISIKETLNLYSELVLREGSHSHIYASLNGSILVQIMVLVSFWCQNISHYWIHRISFSTFF